MPNPVEAAMLDQWKLVKQNVDARSKIKKAAEEVEDFSDNDSLAEKYVASQGDNKMDVELFQEVEGGYQASDIVLLEDGYIINRVLFERGAMKTGYDKWKKEKKSLLVNNSHTPVMWDLMSGAIGAITDLRLEEIDEEKGKKKKYRLMADVFLDGRNPVAQWIVSFGNRMNQLLKSAGEEGNIFSVSAEVFLDKVEFKEFAGAYVPAVSEITVDGMGIVFNPANVSSFGTVESLSAKAVSALAKSPLYNFEQNLMTVEQKKARLEELKALATLTPDQQSELKTLEPLSDEESAEAKSSTKSDDEEESQNEEKGEDEDGGNESEDSREDEDGGNESEDTRQENSESINDLKVKLSESNASLSSLKASHDALIEAFEALRAEMEEYKSGDLSLLSRNPSGGQKGKELSLSQRVSRDGIGK